MYIRKILFSILMLVLLLVASTDDKVSLELQDSFFYGRGSLTINGAVI
jgi:hypothetical protein